MSEMLNAREFSLISSCWWVLSSEEKDLFDLDFSDDKFDVSAFNEFLKSGDEERKLKVYEALKTLVKHQKQLGHNNCVAALLKAINYLLS